MSAGGASRTLRWGSWSAKHEVVVDGPSRARIQESFMATVELEVDAPARERPVGEASVERLTCCRFGQADVKDVRGDELSDLAALCRATDQ